MAQKSVERSMDQNDIFLRKTMVLCHSGRTMECIIRYIHGAARQSIIFNDLTDWSNRPEEGIRYYSGIAVYTKSFDLPEDAVNYRKTDIYLDLGRVKNLGTGKT